MPEKKASKAASPPAEAPMPTTGKPVISVSGGWLTILLLSVAAIVLLLSLSFEGLVTSFLCVVITVSWLI